MHGDKIVARASRRINMLKRIKGPGWGASVNIILSTDKVLIRPIIDYAPFATIIMNKALQNKLEKVQRAAIRIAIQLIFMFLETNMIMFCSKLRVSIIRPFVFITNVKKL